MMAIQALNRMVQKHTPGPPWWTIGQKVWLDAKNLALPYGTIKLAPRRHGPFKIEKVLSPVAYQLCLPPQWTIHPVFHTSLLTRYTKTKEHRENYSRPQPDLIDNREQYEVKTIRSHQCQGRRKQLQYLIKWKGYPESNNTWEPAGNLQTPTLLKEYHHRHPLKSIKRVTLLHQQYPLTWLPCLITLTASTTLTPQPSTGICHHPLGTSTMMLLNHLLPLLKRRSAAKANNEANLLNTITPTPPSVETPSVSITSKKCWATPTPPSTLLQHPNMAPPPLSKAMPALLSKSLMSLMPSKLTTYWSHRQLRCSMSPPHPLHPFRRSPPPTATCLYQCKPRGPTPTDFTQHHPPPHGHG